MAALPGHTWLAQPEGSLFSTIQLQSLCMWRGIACARYWGFLAAVAAHPTHCLWCMLSKQSPGSSQRKDEESQLSRADKVFCREPQCFHGILKAKGLGMLHLASQFCIVQVVVFCNLQRNSQTKANLYVSEKPQVNNTNSSQCIFKC